MRPAPFTLHRAASIPAALAAMANGAQPLAGGQSLLQAMRLRDAEPRALLDLNGIAGLDDAIRCSADRLVIGAHVTHRALLEHGDLARRAPWLSEAARTLGDVQVRNLGTVLGNVCWADPRANMAVALLASDAVVVAASNAGEQRIALGDFFIGFRRNALDGRLAIALEVPLEQQARGSYLEFSRQRQDLALVNVCVVNGAAGLRIAVGGIDPRPVRLTEVERDGLAALDSALNPANHAPPVDQHGDARYKLHLAAVLTRRALAAIGAAG